MTDFATLVLGIDAKGMKEGTAALDTVAVKAEQTENRVTKASSVMSRNLAAEMKVIERTSGNMGFAVQNAAYQLGDFFVMVQGGISPMRALSTQLPQLLGSFGLWGAVIGGVVAAGSVLVPMLFDTGREAKAAGEGLEEANAALAAFKGYAKTASQSAAELTETYGRWGAQIAYNSRLMAQQNIVNAQTSLAANTMVAPLNEAAAKWAEMADAAGTYAQMLAMGMSVDNPAAQSLAGEVNRLRAEAEEAALALGLTGVQAATLKERMDELGRVKGAAAIADAANRALAYFQSLPPEVISSSEALKDAYAQAALLAESAAQAAVAAETIESNSSQIAPAFAAATAAAYGLNAALQTAAGYAASLRSTIEGMDFTNIGLAAQNAALQAGSTAAAASAAGRLAEQQAKLAPMLGSQDAILRAAAQTDLARYKATLDTNLALVEQNSALVTAANASTKAAGGGKALKEQLTAAERAAKELADTLTSRAETAVKSLSTAFGDFVASGFRDFKGLTDAIRGSFRSMLSDLVAQAAANPIRLAMGMTQDAKGAWGLSPTSKLGSFTGGFSSGLGSVLSGLSSGGLSGAGGALTAALKGISGGGLAGLGTAIGALAGPVAAVSLLFSAFKTKTTLLDSGLRATVTGVDAVVETFTKLEKASLFGLIKRTSTTVGAADAATTEAVQVAVKGINESVLSAAKVLGIAGSAFDAFTYSLSVSTKGMSEDQALKAVQDAFGQMGDAMAGMVSGLDAFRKPTEGLATTLQRLADAASAVNSMTDTLGLAFKAVGLSGASLASDLVDRFGSLDTLASASQSYYQAFYSEAERTSILTRQTTAALAAMGLSLPATRDGFRALVEAQDLSTEEGRKTFAALLGMSGAIAELLPSVTTLNDALDGTRKTLRAYIEDLTGTASELSSPAMALASSRAAYNRALAATAAGEDGAASSLTSAASAMLAATKDSAMTALDVARAQATVIAQLSAVAGGGLVDTAAAPALGSIAAPPTQAAPTSQDATVASLRDEIAGLRDLIARVSADQLTLSKRASDTFQKWDKDGMPAVRT